MKHKWFLTSGLKISHTRTTFKELRRTRELGRCEIISDSKGPPQHFHYLRRSAAEAARTGIKDLSDFFRPMIIRYYKCGGVQKQCVSRHFCTLQISACWMPVPENKVRIWKESAQNAGRLMNTGGLCMFNDSGQNEVRISPKCRTRADFCKPFKSLRLWLDRTPGIELTVIGHRKSFGWMTFV